jgi:hypothetical protein
MYDVQWLAICIIKVEVPTMLSQSDRRNRGAHKFSQIKLFFFKFSFFTNTISVWNRLPQSIALSPNIESFKENLKKKSFIWLNLCAPRLRLSDWDSIVGTSTKPQFILYSSIRLALVRLQARLSHCNVSIILVTAPGDRRVPVTEATDAKSR